MLTMTKPSAVSSYPCCSPCKLDRSKTTERSKLRDIFPLPNRRTPFIFAEGTGDTVNRLKSLLVVLTAGFLVAIALTSSALQSQSPNQIGTWTFAAEAVGLGGLIITDVSVFLMERGERDKKERLLKIQEYHRQLNDRVLKGWLLTQVQQVELPGEEGDYPSFRRSRYKKVKLYVQPVLDEFDERQPLPLRSPHDSKATTESVEDWYERDARLHLWEFPEAFRAGANARKLTQAHNRKVSEFVEWEDGIVSRLNAISISEKGKEPAEIPPVESLNMTALLDHFASKYQDENPGLTTEKVTVTEVDVPHGSHEDRNLL